MKIVYTISQNKDFKADKILEEIAKEIARKIDKDTK